MLDRLTMTGNPLGFPVTDKRTIAEWMQTSCEKVPFKSHDYISEENTFSNDFTKINNITQYASFTVGCCGFVSLFKVDVNYNE